MQDSDEMKTEVNTSVITAWEDSPNMFNRLREGIHMEQERLEQQVQSRGIDFEHQFAVGLCIGIIPELAEELSRSSHVSYMEKHAQVSDSITDIFVKQNIGFEVYRSSRRVHVLGVFQRGEEAFFVEEYLIPFLQQVENRFQVQLCVGIGIHVYEDVQLHNSYETAQYASELYFFERKQVLEFEKLHVEFKRSPDEYDAYLEEAFHAVLVKDPQAMEKIDAVMDLIREMHYGNWQAVLMRSMNFTGEMGSRLKRYRMLQSDFYMMQDKLQVKVLNALTFQELFAVIHDHFEQLLPELYKTNRANSKLMIEQVKSYIQENFMENLSIEELAEVACVSPNYFSHLFKNETGENYKTYHTKIRMKKALELLTESDYKLYEICEKIGYNNVRTFVDAFKKEYSVSPMKYKKSLLAKQD